MKKVALLSIGLLALAACNNSTENTSENVEVQTEQANVGGETDEHGCLTAAGETWSVIKQSCVQIFNVGQRLNPIEVKEGDAIISAFVLFNEDKSKLELFLPNDTNTVILNKTAEAIFQKDSVKFDANNSILYIGDQEKYKAE